MSTGQLVGVFDKPLLLQVHQDPLTTDGADVVRQTPARHAPLVVVLKPKTAFVFKAVNGVFTDNVNQWEKRALRRS